MTDRRCNHGAMPHEHCQRCADFSDAGKAWQEGIFLGLMKSAQDYKEARIVRAFLRQEMKRLGIELPPPQTVISLSRNQR